MLLIRKEQSAALSTARDRQLAVIFVSHVLEVLPALRGALDQATLERITCEAIVQGRGFGLKTDQELGEFVGLVFVCGEGFLECDEYAWARDLLKSARPGRVREVSETVERQLVLNIGVGG